MALEVIVDDVSLDLFEDPNFYITEQIHDLADLQTRNASFTKILEVPLTDLNKSVLQNTFPVINGQSVPPSKLRAQVLMSGVPIILDGQVSAGISQDDSISLLFYYQNFEFFDSLFGSIKILNWNDLNFTFDATGWNANKANTSGLVTALGLWLDGITFNLNNLPATSSIELEHDLNFSGFHIYFREILTRIVEQAGFTFDDSDMVGETDYLTLALACPVETFATILDVTNPVAGEVDRITSSQFENTEAIHRVEFNNIINETPPPAVWNVGLFQWDITVTAAVNIIVNIDGEYSQNGNRSSSIRVVKNTTILQEIDISDLEELNLSFELSASVVNGDLLAVEIDLDSNSTIDISIGSNFIINEVGTTQNRDISVAEHLPDIDKNVFIESVLAYFNAIIDTNDDTKTVKILKFSDIKGKTEQDLTANLDISRQISENNGLGSYFQASFFKYQDSRVRRTDSRATFLFNDDTLEQTGVLIELEFGDSDTAFTGTLYTRSAPLIEIPNYEFEAFEDTGLNHTITTNTFTITGTPIESIKVGDYIESTQLVGAQFRDMGRVIQVTPTFVIEGNWLTTGANVDWRLYRYKVTSVDAPRISNIIAAQGDYNVYNGSNNTRAIVQNGLEAEFSDSMLWSSLKAAHYDTLLNALNPAKVIRATFLFTPQEFKNIDLKKPVYLKNFGNQFFINRIDQYRENEPCRMTLIAI